MAPANIFLGAAAGAAPSPACVLAHSAAAIALLVLATAVSAAAGTVTGTVHNGTNQGKPTAGVDVILIKLQGGMEPVAQTKTDSQGRYHLENDAIGQGPMLIRARLWGT